MAFLLLSASPLASVLISSTMLSFSCGSYIHMHHGEKYGLRTPMSYRAHILRLRDTTCRQLLHPFGTLLPSRALCVTKTPQCASSLLPLPQEQRIPPFCARRSFGDCSGTSISHSHRAVTGTSRRSFSSLWASQSSKSFYCMWTLILPFILRVATKTERT